MIRKLLTISPGESGFPIRISSTDFKQIFTDSGRGNETPASSWRSYCSNPLFRRQSSDIRTLSGEERALKARFDKEANPTVQVWISFSIRPSIRKHLTLNQTEEPHGDYSLSFHVQTSTKWTPLESRRWVTPVRT